MKELCMENLVFKDFDLSTEVKRAISDMGFEEATPIQSQAIPQILTGIDFIGQAQTGTGKTCAFGIPAIESVDATTESVQVLVLCPTRELCIQTSEELKQVSKYKEGIKILPIYGGQPIDRQIMALKKRPKIVIGTPGRVMDHLRRKTLKLDELKMIVLDEADEMLNMGFREDIDIILEKTPSEKQTVLFSATMPKEILDLTSKYQKNPMHIKIAHKELTTPSIEQFYLEVSQNSKLEVLSRLMDTGNIKLAVVFCNTKKRVDEVSSALQSRGYATDALHGDMKQEQRDKVMSQFRKGSLDILVATDVAARGIDVDNIEVVFNYDIPSDEEYYVHRIGRTGRAGRSGIAYTFVTGREIYKLKDIQKYTKSNIKPMTPPSIADVEEHKMTNMLEQIRMTCQEGHLTKYVGYLEKLLEDMNAHSSSMQSDEESMGFATSMDLAAGMLKMLIASQGSQPTTYPDLDEVNHTTSGKSSRLFMNIGKVDKIQPKDILVGMISATGMSGKHIGSIDLYDHFSFVEVPKEFEDVVLTHMNDMIIKGKKIKIEKSNQKLGKQNHVKMKRSNQKKSFAKPHAKDDGKPPKRSRSKK